MVILFLLLTLTSCDASNRPKALITVPGHSGSQLTFYSRCAKLLVENGVDVTMLVIASCDEARKFKPPTGIKSVTIDGHPDSQQESADDELFDDSLFRENVDPLVDYVFTSNFFSESAKHVLKRKDVLEDLRKENFDIGYANAYSYISTGILHVVGVKTTALLASGNLVYHYYYPLGVPVPWSYVPSPASVFSDRMTTYQRFRNAVHHAGFYYYQNVKMLRAEEAEFKLAYGDDFPSLYSLASKLQLAFISCEEMIDFPRPIMHKLIYIAGIGMSKPNPLSQEWHEVLEQGKAGNVLFSFGTNIKAHHMPKELRDAIFEAFEELKDYQFIVKVDNASAVIRNSPNVRYYEWFPQTDLLYDKRVKAIFTHGGFNTIMESIEAGKPMVVMPLFGDQMANGHQVQTSGVAVVLDKTNTNKNAVLNALKDVLDDSKGYKTQAVKVSRMVTKKPMSADDLFVQWSKFLIEFKNLDNLRPASAEMSYFQYLMLDVIAVVVVLAVLAWKLFKLCLRSLYRRCCKRKTE